jgi:hypothetical protein
MVKSSHQESEKFISGAVKVYSMYFNEPACNESFTQGDDMRRMLAFGSFLTIAEVAQILGLKVFRGKLMYVFIFTNKWAWLHSRRFFTNSSGYPGANPTTFEFTATTPALE